eukprot:TRINITY_DN6800_c0_g2_i1.p1 TRINITY_DN6800_c0_g2~~TRINITY_DN6800_c0_g2_i1.p1  ORF type:complete len:128 (+),score=11.13 TRINITY_DN6800_c0_g2_i1:1212-1595(+)
MLEAQAQASASSEDLDADGEKEKNIRKLKMTGVRALTLNLNLPSVARTTSPRRNKAQWGLCICNSLYWGEGEELQEPQDDGVRKCLELHLELALMSTDISAAAKWNLKVRWRQRNAQFFSVFAEITC